MYQYQDCFLFMIKSIFVILGRQEKIYNLKKKYDCDGSVSSHNDTFNVSTYRNYANHYVLSAP